eukprot:7282921-Alexandrium_andersonii.AAC.1
MSRRGNGCSLRTVGPQRTAAFHESQSRTADRAQLDCRTLLAWLSDRTLRGSGLTRRRFGCA